jgi:glycosyltransferase involved in cell wall biosynthesis
MVMWIREQVKRVNPDVVLTFGDNFNPLVLLALSGLKYPVFISDRTSPDFKFHPLVNKGKQLLYPKSAGFIAQSSRAAEYKKKHFGDKLNIRIIPNAIKEVKLYDVERKKQIVYVGRLSIEKGPDRLLEAFGKIKQNNGWKLVFAGSGPMMEELKEKTKAMGIDSNVVFLGQVKEVDKLLAESSIFVLPSRLEGFPNALCEAMAAGLPSICFDCIPSGDVITNGEDGFIVPDGDTDALAKTIQDLMDSEELRRQVATKALLIRERLSPERTGKMFLDFMFNKQI